MKVNGYAIEHTPDGWEVSLTSSEAPGELTMTLEQFVALVYEVSSHVGLPTWRAVTPVGFNEQREEQPQWK